MRTPNQEKRTPFLFRIFSYIHTIYKKYIIIFIMTNDPEIPTSSNTKADATPSTQPETDEKTRRIITGSLRFLASIFLICATVYFHPDVDTDIDSVRDLYDRIGAFFMTAFALLGLALVLELQMKRDKGAWIVGASMVAVLILFIGSILTLHDVQNDIDDWEDAFSGCFIAGTVVLGVCQVLELMSYLRQDERNQILLFSTVLAILGTIFLFLGAVFSIEEVLFDYYDYYELKDNLDRRAALFITGGVLYMVHAIVYLTDTMK